jgi:flagellar basal-body rod protein FlgB
VFNDIATRALTASMLGASARQQVISQNIANADTPGYKRMSVDFEGALAAAIEDDRATMASARSLGGGTGSTGSAWWDRPPGTSLPGRTPTETAQVGASVTRVDTTTVRIDGSNVDPDDEMSQLAANQLAYNTSTSLLQARFGQLRAVISRT